ncbi:glycoside hydrolase family 97 protein [Zunongwangia pacifica]|uniref:Glycoside hydrolase family 97 protein n=1 Tax=Zunongwangia pacifica TaxID=2911062 RepID=A0A9X2CQY7_9FLAO|nr:glycoside hydrolase family 97 protein [Zunongwangia pacifica]MCL6220547.1 glycoside hydrolase family 97 protein [Zunongwangia pacifica]
MITILKNKLSLTVFFLGIFMSCMGASVNKQRFEITSPNKKLKVLITVGENINYTLFYSDQKLLENNELSLVLKNKILGKSSVLKSHKISEFDEVLTPVIPLKFSTIKNQYTNLYLSFKEGFGIDFRAYNDGFAYRFVTNISGEVEVIDEHFAVNFPKEYRLHLQQTPSFKTNYEYPYTHLESGQFNAESKMSTLPILIETSGKYKILISESNLFDYPAMFIKGINANGVQSIFPKNPKEFEPNNDRSVKIIKEAEYIAKTDGKRSFPWRYFMVSENDGDLLENTLTYRLAPENQIKDPSWIRPGQVSWEWWNGASAYGVDFVSGYNEETYKYYIDFASEFGIPYIIMDEGWAKSTTNPYIPNPDIDLFQLIAYGKDRNVDIVLWLPWLTVENNFELFKTFNEWGIAGIKIDFMDRSDQWMVNFYERVAKEAAKNKLFIDFHGAFKPAGLERAYPNVLAYEGVLGMEQMNRATPDNSIYLPFMRNAVGSMDYTPGAMLSMQPEIYHSQRPNAAGIGTRAYQMALFVIFESGLQMLADSPSNYYRERECTKFITSVPVTWDETRALESKLGEYVIVAKRKGEDWYIGAITNNNEAQRVIQISLNFLEGDSTYKMNYFEDGVNAAKQAMDYRTASLSVNKSDKFKIKMVRNGGFTAVLKKIR